MTRLEIELEKAKLTGRLVADAIERESKMDIPRMADEVQNGFDEWADELATSAEKITARVFRKVDTEFAEQREREATHLRQKHGLEPLIPPTVTAADGHSVHEVPKVQPKPVWLYCGIAVPEHLDFASVDEDGAVFAWDCDVHTNSFFRGEWLGKDPYHLGNVALPDGVDWTTTLRHRCDGKPDPLEVSP